MNCPICNYETEREAVMIMHIRHNHTDYDKVFTAKIRELRGAKISKFAKQEMVRTEIHNEYNEKARKILGGS